MELDPANCPKGPFCSFQIFALTRSLAHMYRPLIEWKGRGSREEEAVVPHAVQPGYSAQLRVVYEEAHVGAQDPNGTPRITLTQLVSVLRSCREIICIIISIILFLQARV